MAHQLEQMAYVGETPWHGLGNQLSPHQPIEVWAQQAGMDWRIESSNVSYMAKNDRGQTSSCLMKNNVSYTVLIPMHLYRWSANVFRKFNPGNLEFYRDLTEQSGFELETAGVLKGEKVLGFGTYRTNYSSFKRVGCQ